jgi:MFS family permease
MFNTFSVHEHMTIYTSQASFYSTLAMSVYGFVSFFCSPVVATLSDSIGRKPIMILAAFTDSYTTIISGLIPSNFVYILTLGLQGAGDTSQAVGLSLIADCVSGMPRGYFGSSKDNLMCRTLYGIIRSKRFSSSGTDKTAAATAAMSSPQSELQEEEEEHGDTKHLSHDEYIQLELNTQFTVVLILQTVGVVIGIGLGDLMYHLTDSYEWSIAFGGFLCIPCIFYIMFYMPETLSFERRKPFHLDACIYSVTSQV